MSELTTQLRVALVELAVDRMLPDEYDGATENAIGHVERALEIAETPELDSAPGYARFTGSDTPQDIERKMRTAFSPLRAMAEGYARAFDAKHHWRDLRTGRFIPRSR